MAGRILLGSVKTLGGGGKVNCVAGAARRWNHAAPPEDPVIHTGQKFEKDDYRLARFVDKKKHVNQQFAIKLIDDAAPAPRNERVVWCDGGGGPTGHPKVYINLDKPGNHTCGYCGLRFYKEPHH